MVNPIKKVRQTRGWTSAKLNAELRQAARRLGVATAGAESLRVLISAWENDRQLPDLKYRHLLQVVFGVPAAALGFPTDDTDGEVDELAPLVRRGAERLVMSDGMLSYFRRQLSAHLELDNAAGPGLVLDVVTTQVRQVRRLAERGPAEAVELAAQFTEYAGWLHQDSGELATALKLSDEAVDLADLAGNHRLIAYTLMRKSNILTALGDWQRADVTAQRAARLAARSAPDQHAVCLRQVALSAAAQNNEGLARQAIEQALGLLTGLPDEPNALSAYCTTPYVEMEQGLCLLMLGQPAAAAAACSRALAAWPAGLVRDEGLCLVRLAVAQLRMNQVEEACAAAVQAIDRVQVAPSARTLEQLRAVSQQLQPFRDARSVREFRTALAQVA